MEGEEEELEARLAIIEGKVHGVVKEAAAWNSRERTLLGKLKEESLLVKHLTQREQTVLNEHRELAARAERAEKKAKVDCSLKISLFFFF